MSCHEIGVLHNQVRASLSAKVNNWAYNLQCRYGDPRVYAMQQQQMNHQEAALAHDLSRRNSALLQDAYQQQRNKNSKTHNERIQKARTKTAKSREQGTPPGSGAGPPHKQ